MNKKYEVIWAKSLERPSAKFKERMKKYSTKDIRIYSNPSYPEEKIKLLLKKVGINYKAKNTYPFPEECATDTGKIQIDWEASVPFEMHFYY